MRHLTASIVCAAALALGIAGYNHPVSAHGDGGGTLASRIYSVATTQLMPDSARRLAGRLRSVMRPLQAAQSQPVIQPPTVWTDHEDYAPGSTVYIYGSGWQNNELVTLHLVESSTDPTLPLDTHPDLYATADEFGNFENSQFSPDYHDINVTFTLTATGQSGSAQTIFHDANPSANLDQCANDQAPSPSSDGCNTNANQWVNGNIGASKAVYLEGDTIPYRLLFDNIPIGNTHVAIIEWDTTKSSKHAIDYITTVNQSVLTANPCLGVSGCSSFTTFPIPADPQVTGAGITPIAGNFRLYGGTISAVSAYTYSNGAGFIGDKSAAIAVSFTSTVANPVLSWGGHIATRRDWGAGTSAVSIPGSPYHTRLIDLDGSGGNQDRSLSAEAVIFPATITIIKQATPESATSFGFTASPTPLTNFSLVDDGTIANTKVFTGIITFGNYTVNESSIPTGWGFDSVSCVVLPLGGNYSTSTTTVTIAVEEGQNWICTYLNSERAGTLKVIKHVVNDNGGTAVASDWSLHVKSGGVDVPAGQNGSPASPQPGQESPGTQYTLLGGTYNVSETGGPSAYTFTGFSGDCDSSGNVTVVAGQNKTCTLTNDDVAPKLHLRKIVTNDNGGTKTVADFTLTADGAGTNDISGTSPVDSGATLKADTFALSETTVTGYTASAWSCVGGTQNGANITVGIGGEATCTITNNDNPPKLHLRKVVVNDNGGTATVANFTLTADGAGSNDLSGTSPVDSGATLKADTFALSESSPAGYTASAWSCVGGVQNGSNITLGQTEEATCTITNNDIAPKLHLRKVVVNDNNGTKTVADFTLTANGTGSNDLSGTSPVDSGAGLLADTWALSETNVPGYTASAWSCVGGTQNGSNITVGIGGESTCTITNNDNAPGLHLRKVVVNDNGGTATVANFTLTADGTGSNDLSGTSPVDSTPSLLADTFALSESSPAGYTASAWVCVGGTQNGSNITVGLGESATCTITNDDIAPKLHLRKVVVNDNGGTKTVADFTLTADGAGANDLSGTSPVDSGATLKADTFALSETIVTGYTASAWSCVGGTQSAANITVGIGGESTCTITNNDNAPKLHLRKVVVNDNGGLATAANFTLTADGAGSNDISGTSPVDSGATLKADTFALSETTLAGYTASAWSCVGGVQNGSSITLGQTEEATCTITNNDIAPKLHLRKVVVNNNGGTATVANFTLTADGTGTNDLQGTSPVDSGAGLKADTWTLTESTVYGYAASAWSCVGGTQAANQITVGIGGEATCTITNDDLPGTIIIKKVIKPTGAATQFSFDATGTGYVDFSLAGGDQNSQNLNAGLYSVLEMVPLGWVLTGIGGSSDPTTPYACTVAGSGGSSGLGDLNTQTATINLKNGDVVTCVFENTGEGVTRTQGFWATHPQLAEIAWFGGTAFGHTFPGVAAVGGIGDTSLCGKPIADLGDLMGAFWSDVSKDSNNQKRSALDQARMQLLQQLIAAELNASAFGSVPASGSFAAWESAYCGTNLNAIKTAQQQSASFNTNGDSGTFTPGTSADSKAARAVADKPRWDVLP